MIRSIGSGSLWRHGLCAAVLLVGSALYARPADAQVDCQLADSSSVLLSTQLGDIGPLPALGAMGITCEEQLCVGDCDGSGSVEVNELVIGINIATGMQDASACPSFGDASINSLVTGVVNGLDGCPERQCGCEIKTFDPLNIPGIGYVCISPAPDCPSGTYTCDGGPPLDVLLEGDRNIGDCTSNEDCDNQCDAFCAAIGSTPTASAHGCEGFCSEGGSVCLTDADCTALGEGACNGPDNVPAGNICECQCLDRAVGEPSPAGTLSCTLGSDLVVEVAAPCDGEDVLITVGSQCIPLTSTVAVGFIENANNVPGNVLQATTDPGPGTPLACSTYDSGSVSGLKTRGQVIFFGSTVGDLVSGLVVDCE